MWKGKLISCGTNAKTIKGDGSEYLTAIMYLAPWKIASSFNVCANAEIAKCIEGCLFSAGRGQMQSVSSARIRKTLWFANDRVSFMQQLVDDIERFVKYCDKRGIKPCVRLNGTSDIRWETIPVARGEHTLGNIFLAFPQVQFYDYTKSFKRMCAFLGKPFTKDEQKFPSNYHLTFSRSENNDKKCEMVLAMGGNVAVVFRNQLPKTWKGYEVINGDENDLRFLDKKGVVVGLIEKGMAKKDETGFVQEGIDS